jgi:hypothetical protein
MVKFFVLCLIGRLCIFLLQKFPFWKLPVIGKLWKEGGFLHDLFACDLCLGVWVYTVLACFSDVNLTMELFYVPFISEFVTGGIISFLIHLVRVGYQAEFSIIEVH